MFLRAVAHPLNTAAVQTALRLGTTNLWKLFIKLVNASLHRFVQRIAPFLALRQRFFRQA
jgi:hypothetical protein